MYILDHTAIAVPDLDAAIAEYQRNFGFKVDLREKVPSHKVEVVFLKLENTLLELLAPTDETSTVATFLKKRGAGLHHICFRVPDIKAELKRLSALGVQLIDKDPRPGAHHSLVAFIHPKSMGGTLIELCQRD